MKKSLILLTLPLLLLGCGGTPELEPVEDINYAQVNCEQSGGTYAEDTCVCPEGEVNGGPLFTYNEKSGHCIDAFGIPGGELGEQAKAEHAENMEKNKAE